MTFVPAPNRYDRMQYRRSGRSGLQLPEISLGLWNNFGHDRPYEARRAIVRRAFDLGITHFDLANNYGPPYGSAEENFGRMLRDDLGPFRDELVISTKAGYDMWPGPYGDLGLAEVPAREPRPVAANGWGSTTSTSSTRTDSIRTRRSRRRWARSTRPSARGRRCTPGSRPTRRERTREAAAIMRELGTPLLIHQPSYSMLNRWIEPELLDVLEAEGIGCIAFSPLAQGMLTDRYLNGIPEGSRASRNLSLSPDLLTEETLAKVRALNEIAQRRGQTLAQMAIAWTLRDARVTSALIGASSVEQLEANVAALDNLEFTAEELARSTAGRPRVTSTSGPARPRAPSTNLGSRGSGSRRRCRPPSAGRRRARR